MEERKKGELKVKQSQKFNLKRPQQIEKVKIFFKRLN